MGEEFQAGVCGSTWWSSPISSLGLSPCSAAISTDHHMGNFGWASHDLVDMNMKARSGTTTTDESAGSVSDGQPDSGGGVLMDSTLQMMGIGLSSPSSTATTDWNQALVLGGGGGGSGGRGNNYHSSNSILQEDMINSRLKFRQETRMDCSEIGKEWSSVNNNISAASERPGLLYINQAKQRNRGFPMDETRLSSNCTTTSQALPSASFPMSLSSYGYPSNLLQTLFDDDTESDPQPALDNRSVNYSSATNYHTNMNEFSPSMAQLSPLIRPSLQPNPIQQHSTTGSLQQTNSKPLWNTSTAALNDHSRGSTYFPSMQAQFLESTFEEKPGCPSLKRKAINEVAEDSKKNSSSEPAFKRPRVETPSLLPTFKVRKEKLGDRITALQQLVSPFGKTDTASVLQEAIEYIKFLHDQVLRTPYMNMKNGALIPHQQHCHKLKDSEGPKQDLRSRGLCLVPVSSTYPVASETTADFWTPAFGGTAFR